MDDAASLSKPHAFWTLKVVSEEVHRFRPWDANFGQSKQQACALLAQYGFWS